MQAIHLPFKTVAGALLLAAFLGPIGLLYASAIGGVIMMIFSFILIYNQLATLVLFIWLMGCAWSVIAVNRYNKKILKQLLKT